jgi:uncharacterized membrane protein
MLQLALRFTHVFLGALWVGMMAFQTFFLMPSLGDVGPEGGKIMGALMRRRIPIVMAGIALLTIVSGIWLFQRLSGGNAAALMATSMGKGFAFGGTAALIAFLYGVIVLRPAMMRSVQLAATGDPSLGPEIQRLRARGATGSKIVAGLLFLALAAMSVARYL